jgi:hypothetical protein
MDYEAKFMKGGQETFDASNNWSAREYGWADVRFAEHRFWGKLRQIRNWRSWHAVC